MSDVTPNQNDRSRVLFFDEFIYKLIHIMYKHYSDTIISSFYWFNFI